MVEEKIKFFYPIKTLPISLTGESCFLNCLHCSGSYLKEMKTKEKALEILENNDYSSVLISGGFNIKGGLDIIPNLDYLKQVKSFGKKIILHSGFIKKSEIDLIKGIVDVISFDFIYDKETIQEVYHLPYDGEDYKKEYLLLRRNIKTIPHIIVGLFRGKIKGEYEIVDVLAEIKPNIVVFLILVPTKGTPFQDVTLPDIEEIKKFFQFSKRKLRLTNFVLGCMRPKGILRDEIEITAYESGFDGFVNPGNKLKSIIKDPEIYYECDVLYY
ncbi:MAG TPA: radical SAM protein [Caldisericia bacterium]|nr:radical SAM protein [Caldisericia bacterium]